jgi:hypothetical protein
MGASGRGATTPAPGLEIAGSSNITVCGNRIEGNGGDAIGSSQVLFSGASDNITFCGNAYYTRGPQDAYPDANAFPWYVYDVAANTTLTNTHLYETPGQPAVSVFSPAAQPILAPLQAPQFTGNQFSGLTLKNDSSSTTAVDIEPGSATDSTNSTITQLASQCHVGLGSENGAGHLDTGSAAPSTTYYIFLIAPVAAGSSSPGASCMASTAKAF